MLRSSIDVEKGRVAREGAEDPETAVDVGRRFVEVARVLLPRLVERHVLGRHAIQPESLRPEVVDRGEGNDRAVGWRGCRKDRASRGLASVPQAGNLLLVRVDRLDDP